MDIALVSMDNPYLVGRGGKHIHQLLLEKGLKQLGHNVNTDYYILPSRLKWYTWRLFGKVYAFKKKMLDIEKWYRNKEFRKFDIVHAHDVVSGVAVSKKTNTLVLTVHGYFAREVINYGAYSETERKKVFSLAMDYERKAVEKSKGIIAVDSRIKIYLIEELGCPDDKILVMYNAVDTDTFCPVTKNEVHRIRQILKLPQNKFIVLVPRRFVKKNGVVFAARALRWIKDRDIHMIFAGGGPEKENLLSELENDDRSTVYDVIDHDQIVNYYKAADVILIPSITSDGVEEATSLAMLEGMASGKPVICSNIGGMAEVIKDQINGILVEQKNPEEIARAILILKNSNEFVERLSSNARNYVVENHSYIKHSSKILEFYEKILQKI